MPLDGTVTRAIVRELSVLADGRVDKIHQPERDEIVVNVRAKGANYKMLFTATASCPRVHFVNETKSNPETAPQFCMILRKFIGGGRVVSVIQPDFERVVILTVESSDEMGDRTEKKLIIEIMGKHSNIILCDSGGKIIDAIKRVPPDKSSVRTVLPGKTYFPPPSEKKDPTLATESEFCSILKDTDIYKLYNGLSPVISNEIVHRAGDDPTKSEIYSKFDEIMCDVKGGNFAPTVYYDEKGKECDFSVIPISSYKNYTSKKYESISELLDDFYSAKDKNNRVSQKGSDLRKLAQNFLSRAVKKLETQRVTLKNTQSMEKLKLYGELLTANIYAIKQGMTTAVLSNFYEDGAEVEIPLDPALTPPENAQRYFKKYNKEKRTFTAVTEQIAQSESEAAYLEQILQTLTTCEDETDFDEIRQELAEEGYLKKAAKKGVKAKKSKPLRFVSSDGFDIYVGKNNKQNEELTLRTAGGADIWFHTKTIPGSHVIVRANGASVPDSTLDEAARLAAYYSKGRGTALCAVDYTARKNVKKPNGAKTGTVIYDNYKTAYVAPSEDIVKQLER
ncbi:fibronectin-binding protein A [Clostridia bacterium]|nr:fibronectin-binding protein A [Clostridia bacterium]